MKIWIDGDACPKKVKEILFKTAIRTQISLIIVANRISVIPASQYIKMLIVPAGFDEADKRIEAEIEINDLVITADIPLAAAVIKKGGSALNPRGTLYNESNISGQLAVRNLMAELRDQQLISGGAGAYSAKDAQAFAGQLDKFLLSTK